MWVQRTHTMGFPSFLLTQWCIHILKSNMVDKTSYYSYFLAITVRFIKESPHQNVFKLTLSQKSFYVFRKDRQCKFIFLLSPSLDLMNIISVRALEGMKVAGETLQRSRHTLPTASFYLQPWRWCYFYSVYLFFIAPTLYVFKLSLSVLLLHTVCKLL